MEVGKNALIDIEVIKKERLKKVLIFGTLTTVVIATSVICSFTIRTNSKCEEDNISQEEIINEDVNTEVSIVEELKVPIYTEDAKNRLAKIYISEDEEKIAYLTFDDGPSQTITPQILEILRNENVKATFFVLGSRVELYPELLKQEYEEGHYIANHGYSHVYEQIYSSPQAVLDEYNNTESKIQEVLGDGYSSHLFRFPGGSEGGKYKKIKNEAKSLLEQNDILYINWNSLTNDSVGKPTCDSLINDLKSTANGKNKIVILMHDTGTKQLTVDTLTEIIQYLKNEGYCFKNFYDIMY